MEDIAFLVWILVYWCLMTPNQFWQLGTWRLLGTVLALALSLTASAGQGATPRWPGQGQVGQISGRGARDDGGRGTAPSRIALRRTQRLLKAREWLSRRGPSYSPFGKTHTLSQNANRSFTSSSVPQGFAASNAAALRPTLKKGGLEEALGQVARAGVEEQGKEAYGFLGTRTIDQNKNRILLRELGEFLGGDFYLLKASRDGPEGDVHYLELYPAARLDALRTAVGGEAALLRESEQGRLRGPLAVPENTRPVVPDDFLKWVGIDPTGEQQGGRVLVVVGRGHHLNLYPLNVWKALQPPEIKVVRGARFYQLYRDVLQLDEEDVGSIAEVLVIRSAEPLEEPDWVIYAYIHGDKAIDETFKRWIEESPVHGVTFKVQPLPPSLALGEPGIVIQKNTEDYPAPTRAIPETYARVMVNQPEDVKRFSPAEWVALAFRPDLLPHLAGYRVMAMAFKDKDGHQVLALFL